MKHASPRRLLPEVAVWTISGIAIAITGIAQAASASGTADSQTGSMRHPVQQVAVAQAAPQAKDQMLWQQVTQSKYIIQGADDKTAKATIYAFFDPNCIFCHLGWKLSRHYYQEGLQVRWIPIAFLRSDSASKAAGVLTSADPSKALADGEGGWKGMEDGGGAFHDATVTPAIQKMLDRNKKLFADLGLTGTPGFVYRDAKGAIHVASGISNKHMFTTMTGLAYVQVNDPDLANIPE